MEYLYVILIALILFTVVIFFAGAQKRYIIISIGCIIIYFFMFIGIEQSITQEIPAISYERDNETEFEQTSIKIEGILRKRLFREDEFDGRVEIDNQDVTKKDSMNVYISSHHKGYSGAIFAVLDKDDPGYEQLPNYGNLMPTSILYIETKKDFSEIAIEVIDTAIKVVGPAATLEEAKSIDKALQDLLWED